MRYAAQLPIILHSFRSHGEDDTFSLYTHDLMSVVVVTSLDSYRIGAKSARRVFKIGTLKMEWRAVGWMCACEATTLPRTSRPPVVDSSQRAFTQSVGSECERRLSRIASSDEDRVANTYRQLLFFFFFILVCGSAAFVTIWDCLLV